MKALAITLALSVLVGCGSLPHMTRSLNNTSHGYKLVPDPTGTAPTETVHRFEVRSGDCGYDGYYSDCENDRERSELKEPPGSRIATEGTEFWYKWSVYYPEDFKDISPGYTATGQFHQKSGKRPAWMFRVMYDNLVLEQHFYGRSQVKNLTYVLVREDELRGKWHDIKINVKWTKEDDGFLKVWVNDELKVDYKGLTMTEEHVYLKYGIYRHRLQWYKNLNPGKTVPTQIVYYADVKRTTTEDQLHE